MTGIFWLNWSILALSLTNTILLIWLGTTVLINIEERSWGGWLAAAGLYIGGIFFVSHTAILGYGLYVISIGAALWWVVGLLAILVLPLLWYVMMLWYSGFWEPSNIDEKNQLGRRHRWWFALTLLALIGLVITAFFVQQAPRTAPYPTRGLVESPTLSGFPVVLVLFPAYVILCMGLSLDAVLHPGPTDRLMGELARKQAQPWLVAASIALLLVSFSVLGVFLWLYLTIDGLALSQSNVEVIGYFDLLIQLFIAAAIILVGQAVVAYEIFTGQSLPRKGFLRQWQYAVLLALGFGFVIGFVFSTNLRPIYGILLSTLMMTFFLALFSWRTVSERQRSIRRLRPFVTSQGFYDQLVTGEGPAADAGGLMVPFQALCREVLDTRQAILVALGPMAPLAGDHLYYQAGKAARGVDDSEALQRSLAGIFERLTIDDQILPFPDQGFDGINWLVPLWSQRGLAGVLLIGEKREGGIYSREEIELAQSSGERLIDARVSAEIARRLLSLQRQRLAHTQVVDQRTRRTLHDEILQDIHAAILKLAEAGDQNDPDVSESIEMMTGIHGEISRLLRNLPGTSLPDLGELNLDEALHQLVEDEIGARFDGVSWEIDPAAAEMARQFSRLEQEVLYYASREAMRNAARHGRPESGERPLNLVIKMKVEGGFFLMVEDDGVGFDDGRPEDDWGGQGLALHSTMMAVIGGELQVDSEAGKFTRVTLQLRTTR